LIFHTTGIFTGGIMDKRILFLIFVMGGCAVKQPIQTENKVEDPISLGIEHYNTALKTDSIPLAKEEMDEALSLLLPFGDNPSVDSLIGEVCLRRVKLERKKIATRRLSPLLSGDFLYTKEVDRWIKYYTTDGREYIERALSRGIRYINTIRYILKEEGIPAEFAYLPIVESGFHPYARSSAGAVGLWQIMPGTAKLYGLMMDEWVDERRGVYASTRAAARYLKNLYERFSSWDLVLAAYNWGGGNVNSSIARSRTDDYWELILPRETANFVPQIYATLLIALDPQVYGFEEYTLDGVLDTVRLSGAMRLETISSLSGVKINALKELNPELRDKITPPRGHLLKLPPGIGVVFLEALEKLPGGKRYLTKDEISKYRQKRWVTHIVKRGETLSGISRKYGVSIAEIKRWNPNARRKYIYAGDRLKIYRR
jgi:membrane-bound lytic murein transglycosylase D